MTAPNRKEHFIEKKNLLVHNIPSHEYHGNINLDEQSNRDLDLFNSLYMKHFWSPIYDFHSYMINIITLQNFFQANKLPYIIFNSLNLTPNLLEQTKRLMKNGLKYYSKILKKQNKEKDNEKNTRHYSLAIS